MPGQWGNLPREDSRGWILAPSTTEHRKRPQPGSEQQEARGFGHGITDDDAASFITSESKTCYGGAAHGERGGEDDENNRKLLGKHDFLRPSDQRVPAFVQERYLHGDVRKQLKTKMLRSSRECRVSRGNDFCLPGTRCLQDVVGVSSRVARAAKRVTCTA